MIKVIPFEQEHLDKIVLRDEQASERPENISHQAVTFMYGETPIAILGGYNIGKGVFQAWGLISENAKQHARALSRKVFKFISFIMENLKLQRVQISVRQDFLAAQKWAKFLGFECEGLMKKYGPDGNFWLFARTV